jgi:hypothetical protein
MKHILSFSTILFFLFIYAASSVEKNYFQVYEATPDKGELTNNSIKFEDINCEISYNLWSNGGDIGFNFLNKTSENITINKDKSFFILNGFAYDYYLNRISGTTSNESLLKSSSSFYNGYKTNSYSKVTAESNSTSFQESLSETIPPNTLKRISEYRINKNLVRSCDLLRFPDKKEIQSLNYTKENSPFVFSNLISYTINGKDFLIENKFHVSSVTNYPKGELIKEIYIEYCGEAKYEKEEVFKQNDANKFYIKYSRNSSDLKH